eukprot:scaffold386001_cov31-Prasinocladus_malaysianus.AAC.2
MLGEDLNPGSGQETEAEVAAAALEDGALLEMLEVDRPVGAVPQRHGQPIQHRLVALRSGLVRHHDLTLQVRRKCKGDKIRPAAMK